MPSAELLQAQQIADQTTVITPPAAVAGDGERAADRPSTPSKAYLRQDEDWQTCRDFYAGTRAVHSHAERYLEPFERERPEDYKRRKSVKVYNGFARTVRAMAGMVFQRAPRLGDDVPASILQHWEDIDGKGTHGRIFARNAFRDGITVGFNALLVDYPSVPDAERVSLADEQRRNLRPYWVHYRAEDILSVRVDQVGGATVLTQIVLREVTEVPDGAFGTRERTQYRVLRRDLAAASEAVTFELWEDRDAGDGRGVRTVRVEGPHVVRGPSEIPVAFFYADEPQGPAEARPPLLDLAELNVDHYRVTSDRRYSITLACAPTLFVKGIEDEEMGQIAVGPNAAIKTRNPSADARWLEPAGTSFAPTQAELDRIERQMAAVGLAFLMSETRAAETARGKEIDAAAQNSALTLAVDGLEDALEQCLRFHAQYLKLPDGGSVTLNRDFLQVVLASDMIGQLLAASVAGRLSLDTFLETLKRGNVLPDDVDVEEEKQRILMDSGALTDVVPPDPNAPPAGGGAGAGDAGGGRPGTQPPAKDAAAGSGAGQGSGAAAA